METPLKPFEDSPLLEDFEEPFKPLEKRSKNIRDASEDQEPSEKTLPNAKNPLKMSE